MIISELFVLIDTIICFLEGSLMVMLKFIFQPFVVSDVVGFNNLVRGQFGKSIFDFDNFFNIIFRDLCPYKQLFELEA